MILENEDTVEQVEHNQSSSGQFVKYKAEGSQPKVTRERERVTEVDEIYICFRLTAQLARV